MPSFSSSRVLDAAARAAATLAFLVTSDGRPRLAAPDSSAESGGADALADISMTARAGGSGPVLLAAGGDAGTSATAAAVACASACAGRTSGVEFDVRAGAEGVALPSAGTSAPFANVEEAAVATMGTKPPSGKRPTRPPTSACEPARDESDSFRSVPHLSIEKKSHGSTLRGCSGQRRKRVRARLQHTRRRDVLRLVTLSGL